MFFHARAHAPAGNQEPGTPAWTSFAGGGAAGPAITVEAPATIPVGVPWLLATKTDAQPLAPPGLAVTSVVAGSQIDPARPCIQVYAASTSSKPPAIWCGRFFLSIKVGILFGAAVFSMQSLTCRAVADGNAFISISAVSATSSAACDQRGVVQPRSSETGLEIICNACFCEELATHVFKLSKCAATNLLLPEIAAVHPTYILNAAWWPLDD